MYHVTKFTDDRRRNTKTVDMEPNDDKFFVPTRQVLPLEPEDAEIRDTKISAVKRQDQRHDPRTADATRSSLERQVLRPSKTDPVEPCTLSPIPNPPEPPRSSE